MIIYITDVFILTLEIFPERNVIFGKLTLRKQFEFATVENSLHALTVFDLTLYEIITQFFEIPGMYITSKDHSCAVFSIGSGSKQND